MNAIFFTHMESPVGRLLLVGHDGGLREISFTGRNGTKLPQKSWKENADPFKEVIRQLEAYFEGELKVFKLRLEPLGTPFQQSVWQALRKIPYGKVITYAELARRVGKTGAYRAVGAANGRNPISIVVPCHRVIGSNGKLTGYGGGLEAKRWLLELEGVIERECSLQQVA